jgi:hypothetical protein
MIRRRVVDERSVGRFLNISDLMLRSLKNFIYNVILDYDTGRKSLLFYGTNSLSIRGQSFLKANDTRLSTHLTSMTRRTKVPVAVDCYRKCSMSRHYLLFIYCHEALIRMRFVERRCCFVPRCGSRDIQAIKQQVIHDHEPGFLDSKQSNFSSMRENKR